ncbi:MAG: effector protein [Burkholderiaceae bacterium]|nr:effector protein [Burkholderiaceae bacterium]
MNRFTITNPANCIGCHTCEAACAVAHLDAAEASSFQQDSFRPRLKVIFGREITSTTQCRHCDNAPCVIACPTKALTHVGDTVQFVGERCFGCKTCVIACPYGAINLVNHKVMKPVPDSISARSVQPIAFKCDLCVDRANGPACVEACPTQAIRLTTSASADEMLSATRERATHNPAT